MVHMPVIPGRKRYFSNKVGKVANKVSKSLLCYAFLVLLLSFFTFFKYFPVTQGSSEGGRQVLVQIDQEDSERKFLVPFLKGQGFNNQVWEYRTAAIIARATNRTLCLEPFLRFYLQRKGRPFIPFEDIFDIPTLKRYVNVEVGAGNCAKLCAHGLESNVELVESMARFRKDKTAFPIADWRPGSLKNFRSSTGFERVPNPIKVNINHQKGGVSFQTHEDIRAALSAYEHGKCMSIASPLLDMSEESALWTDSLTVSKNLKNLKSQIIVQYFSNLPYLAIHWRVEESRCAGIGRGIRHGRSKASGKRRSSLGSKVVIKKTDRFAELCFYAIRDRKHIWLRMVSKEALVQWIQKIKEVNNLTKVYIATDLEDDILLRWVKRRTAAVTLADITSSTEMNLKIKDDDILSILEQEICTDAQVFAGTQMSSWTMRVIEKRFRKKGEAFHEEMLNMSIRPNNSNETFYIDVEVCNCEW